MWWFIAILNDPCMMIRGCSPNWSASQILFFLFLSDFQTCWTSSGWGHPWFLLISGTSTRIVVGQFRWSKTVGTSPSIPELRSQNGLSWGKSPVLDLQFWTNPFPLLISGVPSGCPVIVTMPSCCLLYRTWPWHVVHPCAAERSSRHSRFGTSMQTFSSDGSLNAWCSAQTDKYAQRQVTVCIQLNHLNPNNPILGTNDVHQPLCICR